MSPRSFADLFSRLAPRRPDAPQPQPQPTHPNAAVAEREPVFATKALRKFLACLAGSESRILLDLGPVVGTNVTFFGERLGCKIFVEDVFADLERHVRQGTLDRFPEFLARRFPQADASIDGILCWDLFDYLDRAAAQTLASQMTRLLKTDGALLGLFGTALSQDLRYTKYVIVDEVNLRHRPYPASRRRQGVLQNRDIIKLFEGLRVSDSFLLLTNLREILFRKPAYLGTAPAV